MLRKTVPLAALAVALGAYAASPALIPGATVGVIPAAYAAGDARDAYLHEHEGQFEAWGKKVDDFNETAKKKGKAAAHATERKLDAAWSEVKKNWRLLKEAGKDGWQDAKDGFEASWKKFQQAWDEAQKPG